MKNKKILASILIATIGVTGVWYSFADDSIDNTVKTIKERLELTDDQKAERIEMKTIFDKKKAWEELTDDEQAKLDNMKSKKWSGGKSDKMKSDKQWGKMKGNNKWERIELTDEQKAEKEAKFTERKLKNEVIDLLLAWDTLSSEQETLRVQMITDRAEKKAEFELKQAEKAEMKVIFDKKDAWEELTDEEQIKLDEIKTNSKKWGKKGNNKG